MRVLLAALLASVLPIAAHAADRPDQPAFRALYKELVETDTSHAVGDCTLAAKRMAARLKAAGFADADLNVFVPEGLPLDGGLIADFPGTDTSKGAVMLLAHLDVVDAKREDWTRDPFNLVEENGYFYARGASDDKAQAAIWTDTMVRLKASGAKPKRSLKLVLSCGEESLPRINNIRWLIEKHPEWIKAAFALNEGGGGAVDDAGKPVSLGFQAGEKTTANFRIEATNPGGHSSVPRPDNAITALSDALSRVGRYEFPIRLNDVTRSYFTEMGKLTKGETGAAMTRLVANPNDKAADALVSKNAGAHSMLRTTCVATLLEGGHAINALPQRARASVNCRMAPGDTVEDVQAQLVRAIGDAPVTVTRLPPVNPVNPPPPLTDEVYGTAKRVAARHWPGVPMLPQMLTGATDGRFLIQAGIPTYGVPGGFDDEQSGAHGLNERKSVAGLMAERDYLHDLVKAYAGVK